MSDVAKLGQDWLCTVPEGTPMTRVRVVYATSTLTGICRYDSQGNFLPHDPEYFAIADITWHEQWLVANQAT